MILQDYKNHARVDWSQANEEEWLRKKIGEGNLT